jgi:cell division protein FtsL
MVKAKAVQASKSTVKQAARFGRVGVFVSKSVRWALVVVIAVLIIVRVAALEQAKREAAVVQDQLASMEQKKAQLESDVEKFSDPEWRSSFWKWRTMRHEPGEYYIRFYDRGAF